MYSVVIPVFNSEKSINLVTDKTVEFFVSSKLDYEIILVNDGSNDNSWEKIKEISKINKKIKSINLLKNYGQHIAMKCGFMKASGNWIITMDDDLQNDPKEISKLIEKTKDGYDLVIGQYKEKKHSLIRRVGSKLINKIVRKIFYNNKKIFLSNFRIINKDIIERFFSITYSYPYIPGLLLTLSRKPTNVIVNHDDRLFNKSNYSFNKIISLVFNIIFGFSMMPLNIIITIGFLFSALSFFIGVFFLFLKLFSIVSVPGWTSIIVLISIFNGLVFLILGMIGQYLIRFIRPSNIHEKFFITDEINKEI